jgi:hypothetical protein
MIVHIALFKWKPTAKQREIYKVLKEVCKLQAKLSGIIHIYAGKNFHSQAKGYTHGIIIIAKTQKWLDAYRKHPDHVIVAKKIDALAKEGLGFDFKQF